MASRPARRLMTEEEYLRLPESMTKTELLDGTPRRACASSGSSSKPEASSAGPEPVSRKRRSCAIAVRRRFSPASGWTCDACSRSDGHDEADASASCPRLSS